MIRSVLLAPLAGAVLATATMAGPVTGIEADIFILGEVHDNPAHHLLQAEAVAELAPKAMVFEMLTPMQAEAVREDLLDDPLALAGVLNWEDSGWPDFAMYAPIFAAARGAVFFGAEVQRDETRVAMEIGIPESFGDEAVVYGLTEEPDTDQLADRLNLQMEAHCNALPTELLPAMVDLQRLRDAVLARTAVAAFDATGGPVVVITGNGHARKDWGVPSYIARVRPELAVFSLGQSEDGQAPGGGFDALADAPAVAREDPCAAFR